MADRRTLDALFWKAVLVSGALVFLYLSLEIVLLGLIALVLAAAILPLADTLHARWRMPRGLTVTLVYAAGFGVLLLILALLVPVVIDQGQELSRRLPEFQQKINDWLTRDPWGLRRFTGGRPLTTLSGFDLGQLTPIADTLLKRSILVTKGVFAAGLAAVFVLFVAGYVVVDQQRISRGLLCFVPLAHRDRVAAIATHALRRMGGYVRGQAIVSVCVAAILTVGLALVRFESPLLVGVLAGALNVIPWLGSTVAWILALLLGLTSGTFTLIGVIVVFSVEQFIEGHFLVPFFTGKQVELHPLGVFAALIVGANLAGLLGAVVAVPLAAGIDAVLRDTYVEACNVGRDAGDDPRD